MHTLLRHNELRAYKDGAPGPTTPHLQDHSFLHSQQDGDQPAAF